MGLLVCQQETQWLLEGATPRCLQHRAQASVDADAELGVAEGVGRPAHPRGQHVVTQQQIGELEDVEFPHQVEEQRVGGSLRRERLHREALPHLVGARPPELGAAAMGPALLLRLGERGGGAEEHHPECGASQPLHGAGNSRRGRRCRSR